MGIVRMTEEITKEWEDVGGIHPCATATLYVYCDKCGSFSIKSRIGNKKTFLIIVACMLIMTGVFAALQLRDGIYWLCLCIVICILVFRYLWGDVNYVCRKCGSVPTTDYNTLGYPSDMGILDIPNQLTKKRYQDYFPEWYNLDNALISSEVQVNNKDNIISLISQDIERITTFLGIYILSPFLLIILTIIYPIIVVVDLLWTAISSKKDA